MYFVKLLRTAFIIELPLVAAFEFYYDEMVLSCDIFCINESMCSHNKRLASAMRFSKRSKLNLFIQLIVR